MHLHLKICIIIGTLCHSLYGTDDVLSRAKRNGYVKETRPHDGVAPVNVTIQMKLWTMSHIDEHSFTYELSYIMNSWWNDPRLKHNNNTFTFSDHPEKHIWYPELMITNSDNNKRVGLDVVTKIHPNGDIHVNQRMKAKCTCVMMLSDYPMDIQYCPFSMESYAYSASDLRLKWHKDGVIVVGGFAISGYSYEGSKWIARRNKYTIGSNVILWDNLEVKIQVKRSLPYYVFRIYIPSILLMVFNVGSYWIPHGALPGRIGLVVTTFLTNTFILQAVTEKTAKGAATTSLHVFIVANITFIVVAIVEYLLILRLKSLEQVKYNALKASLKEAEEDTKARGGETVFQMSKRSDYDDVVGEDERSGSRRRISYAVKTEPPRDTQNDVHLFDKICRILMPILYFIFCLTYFLYYLGRYN